MFKLSLVLSNPYPGRKKTVMRCFYYINLSDKISGIYIYRSLSMHDVYLANPDAGNILVSIIITQNGSILHKNSYQIG